MKVGARVSFVWFGRRRVGMITAINGIMCDVYSGLHQTTYVVNMNDLTLNPLFA